MSARRYAIGAVCGVLLVALLGATTGGFPSRPRLLSLGVNSAAPSIGNITASGTITGGNLTTAGTVTGANYVGNVGGVDPSGFATLSGINVFTTTNQVSGVSPRWSWNETDAAADEKCSFILSTAGVWRLYLAEDANCTSTTNATAALLVDRTGTSPSSFQYNGVEVCRANGTGCPATAAAVTAYGNFTSGGAINGAHTEVGIASSVNNSAGSYTVTFDASHFSAPPNCMVTINASVDGYANTNSASASIVNVFTRNGATNALANFAFGLVCMGS